MHIPPRSRYRAPLRFRLVYGLVSIVGRGRRPRIETGARCILGDNLIVFVSFWFRLDDWWMLIYTSLGPVNVGNSTRRVLVFFFSVWLRGHKPYVRGSLGWTNDLSWYVHLSVLTNLSFTLTLSFYRHCRSATHIPTKWGLGTRHSKLSGAWAFNLCPPTRDTTDSDGARNCVLFEGENMAHVLKRSLFNSRYFRVCHWWIYVFSFVFRVSPLQMFRYLDIPMAHRLAKMLLV